MNILLWLVQQGRNTLKALQKHLENGNWELVWVAIKIW